MTIAKTATTVFFPKNGGYRKAIVMLDDVDFFISIGAYNTPGDIQETVLHDCKDIDMDPDKGSGRPGSLRWHVLKINESDDRPTILEYVKNVTGKDINHRGRLDYMKKNAIRVIKDHLND